MRWLHDGEDGATAVEYAVIIGLIAVVIVGAVRALGVAVAPPFQNAAAAFAP